MTEHEERIRGADAEQLLANPLLKEALATIEANVVNRMATPDLQPAEILRMQGILTGKRAFERYLKEVVTTGKMAGIMVEQKAQEEEKKRTLMDRFRRSA
jgi:hypothetical protein